MTATAHPIDAVIFDFGGVFTESPLTQFAAFESQHGLPARFLASVIKARMDDGAFSQFERGELDLDTFDRAFLAETTAAGHPVAGRALMDLLSLPLRDGMVQAHAQLVSRGVKTGCITNNTPGSTASDWVEADQRGDVARVFDRFEVVLESATVGLRKPEPAIYTLMCERLGVEPTRCVFLDDLGVNLKPARQLGMHTIKVPLTHWQTALDALEAVLGYAVRDA
ncbi:MAG: HAD-IA family hydrolase [Pseudomonadota bacterium]